MSLFEATFRPSTDDQRVVSGAAGRVGCRWTGIAFATLALSVACAPDDDPAKIQPNVPDSSVASGGGGEGGSGGTVSEDSGPPTLTTGNAEWIVEDAGVCQPSEAEGMAVICLRFEFDGVNVDSDRANFDNQGVFGIQLYSIPNPGSDLPCTQDPSCVFEARYPAPNGGEIAFDELPSLRFEIPIPSLDGAALPVYVRAAFADNPDLISPTGLRPGGWIGGLDLARGVRQGLVLEPHMVVPNAANQIDLDMVSVREFTATIELTGDVPGDGQGKIVILSSDTPEVTAESVSLGWADEPCVDFSSGSADVRGILLGNGAHYLAAAFSDLNADQTALTNVTAGATLTVPEADSILVGSDYTPEVTLRLGISTDQEADGGAVIDTLSCGSDGGVPDGGADGEVDSGSVDSGAGDSGGSDASGESAATDASSDSATDSGANDSAVDAGDAAAD